MNEPANLTAWPAPDGDVWLRLDGSSDWGSWHLLRHHPLGWITSTSWAEAEKCGPFRKADARLTGLAIDKIRERTTS